MATETNAVLYQLSGVESGKKDLQEILKQVQENKEKGKQLMIWGVLGLTVMFSVYALINIVESTLLG